MKRQTLYFVVGLIILASMVLAACAPAPTPAPAVEKPTQPVEKTEEAAPTPTPAPTEVEKPVAAGEVEEITYFYRITSPGQEAHIKWIIDSFNEKYAGKIHVTGNAVDDETYKTKMTVELGGANPPDVFFSWEGGRAKSLIDAGYAAPLDEYYEKYGWDKILNPAGVALSEFDGRKYFVAWEMAAAVFWYRPDIYEQYGLQPPKNWDEHLANAQVLKENGVAPFLLVNQKRWPAQFLWTGILVNHYGLDVYQTLLNNEIPWTDERVVATFEELQNLVEQDLFYPGINSIDLAPGVIPFAKGEAATWYQGTWMVSFFRGEEEDIPFPVDFFTWPQMGDRQPIVEVFAENTVMIHAKSQHKDAAAEFVNYHVSDEVQQKKLEEDRPFPANVNVDYSNALPIERKLAEMMAASGGFTFMHVDHAFDPAIANTFLDATQALVGLAMTPEEAAQTTEEEAIRVRGEVK